MEFDPRLKHPFTCMVVGPTQCGKTQFVFELIRRLSSIQPPPERIVWCFWLLSGFVQQRRWCRICGGRSRHEHFGRRQEENVSHHRRPHIQNRYGSDTNFYERVSSSQLQCDLHKLKFVQQRPEEQKYLSQYSLLVLFKNPKDSTQIYSSQPTEFPKYHKVFYESFADATSLPYS